MIYVNPVNMKFALDFVAKTVATNPYVPILVGVLVKAENGILTLTSTNLEGSSQVKVPCITDKPETFVVEHKRISEYVKQVVSAKGESLDIKVGAKLSLSCDKSLPQRIQLPLFYEPKDFPLFKEPTEGTTIERETLGELLSVGLFTDATNSPVNCIHLSDTFSEATNRYVGKKVVLSSGLGFEALVPASVVKSFSSLKDEFVMVALENNAFYIYDELLSWCISVKLDKNKFYDMRKAWSNSGQNQFTLQKQDLIFALETLKIIGEETIVLEINDSSVALYSKEMPEDKAEFRIPEGELPNSVRLHSERFLSVLKNLKGESVFFRVGTNKEQLIIEEDNSIYFIVPFN